MKLPKNLRVSATGVGSMPFHDVEQACRLIVEAFPDLPFWPQLPMRDNREGMLIQYSENMPCLKPDIETKGVLFDVTRRDECLLEFYEKAAAGDLDYFRISPEYAAGLYFMLDAARNSPAEFLKGQVTGPLTFLASVPDASGQALLFDEMMSDAVIKALALKAAWQAREIARAGKVPLIFFDEPYLAGFGSAFCQLSRERVISALKELFGFVRAHQECLIGVHCCGNTDWGMMLETGLDVINFDFYAYGKNFLLYPKEIRQFVASGGMIAWGAVPTTDFSAELSVDMLADRLGGAFQVLEEKGMSKTELKAASLITTACGLGLLELELAEKLNRWSAGLSMKMIGL